MGVGAVTTALAQMPEIERQPESLTIAPGWRAGFIVEAIGSPPLSYQWYHNGEGIQDENEDLLLLPFVQKSASGAYTVRVSNPLGSVTSKEAQLIVEEYSTEMVDRGFQVAEPSMRRPESIHTVSGRRLIFGGLFAVTPYGEIDPEQAGLHRFLPDGSRDPNWKPHLPNRDGNLTSVINQSENRVVLIGQWVGSSDPSYFNTFFLIRLQDDGTPDPSFTPPPISPGTPLVVGDGDRLIISGPEGWTRYESSGSIDPSYAGEAPKNNDGEPIQAKLAGLDGNGGLIVYGGGYLWHLDEQGRLDPSYGLVEVGFDGGPIQLEVLSDRSVLFLSQRISYVQHASIFGVTYTLGKHGPDGSVDLNFTPWSYSIINLEWAGGGHRLAVQPDGKILVVGEFTQYGTTYRDGIVRLNPDGSLDRYFRSGTGPIEGARTRTLNLVVVEDDGQSAYIGRKFSSFENHKTDFVARIKLDDMGPLDPPRILRTRSIGSGPYPDGSDVEVEVVAVGIGPIVLSSWSAESVFLDKVIIKGVQGYLSDDERYRTIQANGPGGVVSAVIEIPTTHSKPIIIGLPQSLTVEPGRDLDMFVDTIGTAPRTFTWYRDEAMVGEPGEYGSRLHLYTIGSQHAGIYRVVVENALGTAEATATLQVGPRSRLTNLSTRAYTGTGEQALIVGFAIEGASRLKSIHLRGLGPELSRYGVDGYLIDPVIEFNHANGRQLWIENNPANYNSAIPGLPRGTKSAAKTVNLEPDRYTLRVIGRSQTSGVALGEIYDIDNRADRLVNLSSRAFVGRGEKAAIPGFVIEGDAPLTVLVRAIGPGLAGFGVSALLDDPTIRVFSSGSEPLATNDDWDGTAVLESIFETVGAFPLGTESRDAALVLTLDPGAYTTVVSDSTGREGVVLVEVYEVPSE